MVGCEKSRETSEMPKEDVAAPEPGQCQKRKASE